MVEVITIVIYLSVYMGLISTSFYIMSFLAGEKKKKPMYTDDELPKVTVIIPVYNEEDTIAKTIRSVVKSNYPDFEVIVVDDGSTDNTFEIAKKLESEKVRVFHKENGGKGTALNLGIKRARGKIIFTMDADTTVDKESMKKMVRFFKDDSVMCVTPAMVINNPRTIFQRIQYTEYALGLFLRKAFSALKSIYIAPGAFSAYRKAFFDKYGGYDEHNITEDLEMGLRIQYKGFHAENCPEAPAYTNAPATFKELTMQRRRWYFGQVRNLWKYRKIISRKYGDLGAFVIPTSILATLFSVTITIFLFFKVLFKVKENILFLQSVNFDFPNAFNLNLYILERFLFLWLTKPVVLFTLCFMIILGFYTYYASKKIGKPPLMILNWMLFFLLFAVMYGFWWVFSLFYSLTRREIKWK